MEIWIKIFSIIFTISLLVSVFCLIKWIKVKKILKKINNSFEKNDIEKKMELESNINLKRKIILKRCLIFGLISFILFIIFLIATYVINYA